MQYHQQVQNTTQPSHNHKTQLGSPVIRAKTQNNSQQQIKQTLNKVSSSQHFNFTKNPICMLRTSVLMDFSNEILDIKKQFNRLIKSNQMLMKQQIENPEVQDKQHFLSQSLLQKEIDIIRNKFNFKKDQYRKQIQQLKNQLILWQTVTQQNQDFFHDYKGQVQNQLKLIKKDLEKYVCLSQDYNNLTKQLQTQKKYHQQLQKTINYLKNQNCFLLKQIQILKEKQLNHVDQAHDYQLKMNILLIELKNLNESLSIKQACVPINQVLRELEKSTIQNKILKDKLIILQNIHDELQNDLLEAREDTSQQDKQQEINSNIQGSYVQKLIRLQSSLVKNNLECKQCCMKINQLSKLTKDIQKQKQQSLQRAKQFQYGKQYLQNKIKQLQQFINVSGAEYDQQKSSNIERLRQFQILKIKYKQLSEINLSLEQKINSLSQRQLQDSHQQNNKIFESKLVNSKCKNSYFNIFSVREQFQQKQILYLKTISQFEQKIDQLTIFMNNLQQILQVQKKTGKQQISLLKQRLHYLQSQQYRNLKNNSQSQFNQTLRQQIKQIMNLNNIIKDKTQHIYKLNCSKTQIQVNYMNLKNNLEIEKLKKISQIKHIEISKNIEIQTLKKQLNTLKKTQQSLLNKLKSLVEDCKNKDIFIQKHIKSKKQLCSIQMIRADYIFLNNIQQFRNTLCTELNIIRQLENDKQRLMETINKLERVQNGRTKVG